MPGGERRLPALACSLHGPADVALRRSLIRELRHAADRVEELGDGYALRLSGDVASCRKAMEFILFERGCCPFLRFELEFEPGGPLWLRIRGPEGAKEFIAAEARAVEQ